jgi:hypothetical protein
MNKTLLAIGCAVVLGCGQSATPPKDNGGDAAASGPALTSDEKVLLALDAYDPMYQVNAKGRIIKLKLPWRHLPDSILTEINKLTELERLDCHACTLTDDGLAQLKDLQKLRGFGLGATAITDKGLVHLENMRGLRFVWLSKKTISEEAVAKLNEARPDVKVYRH